MLRGQSFSGEGRRSSCHTEEMRLHRERMTRTGQFVDYGGSGRKYGRKEVIREQARQLLIKRRLTG